MPNLLVSYDLNKLGQRYAAVEKHLRAQDAWAKPLETVWVITTTKSATTLRDELVKLVDQNDQILVGTISGIRSYNLSSELAGHLTSFGAM